MVNIAGIYPKIVDVVYFCRRLLIHLEMENNDVFEFITNLYNFGNSDNLNSALIKNSIKLQLTKKYKPCNDDIDPDKPF